MPSSFGIAGYQYFRQVPDTLYFFQHSLPTLVSFFFIQRRNRRSKDLQPAARDSPVRFSL